MTEHQIALNKAKVELMTKPSSAFFTTVCFSLKHEWSEKVPTAATDGRSIFFNPQFFMGLSHPERVFLLIHEAMHVALMHVSRRNDRNARKWNVAADHVINLMLIKQGFRMPEGGLADDMYDGLSTDQVYDLLQDSDTEELPMEDIIDGLPSQDSEQLEEHIQEILVRASIQSKMQMDNPGTIPGEIQIYLDNLLNPKLPWKVILRRYINSFSKNDYSFKKPNRRYFPTHHLPSLFSRNLQDIAIAVDTSGSVSDADFKRFVSELASIMRMMKPKKVTVIQFDNCIKRVSQIRNIRQLMDIPFKGRGGTEIEPVLQWANKHKPQLLLVFTDGYFYFEEPELKPTNPLLWLIHDNDEFSPPFGKVINYDI